VFLSQEWLNVFFSALQSWAWQSGQVILLPSSSIKVLPFYKGQSLKMTRNHP
jgi:hypothetical protein